VGVWPTQQRFLYQVVFGGGGVLTQNLGGGEVTQQAACVIPVVRGEYVGSLGLHQRALVAASLELCHTK
jgi:hypothetical protein